MEIRERCKNGIIDNNLKIDVVKSFFYHYLNTIFEELPDDWMSYGVSIGRAGDRVTPLSLITATVNRDNTVDPQGTQTAEASDDAWMAIYVCEIYRLIRTKQSDYKMNIAARISEQIRAANQQGQFLSEVVDLYLGWQSDRGYNCLIGITDMFFHKFPNHPIANMRISKTGSRYKDCAALMSYGFIIKLLSMYRLEDLLNWVFVRRIGDEIEAMMKDEEELDLTYSYFPYQVDLGLVVKSAFSAVANPHFFEWVHLTGSLLRSKRSSNARHIHDGQTFNIMANAAYMAFVHDRNFKTFKVYQENENVPMDADDAGDIRLNDIGAAALRSGDPKQWIDLLIATDFQLPGPVKRYIKDAAAQITDAGDGTMDYNLNVMAVSL